MSANARRTSKWFGVVAGAGAGLPSSPPPISGKPLTARTMSPAPSASCTIRATTSTRTERPPAPRDSVVGGHRLEDLGEPPARGLAARGHVLGRHAVRGRLVAAQDLARDRLAVDPVGAVVETRGAR